MNYKPGHHIDNQGRFQSDKYPDMEPDRIQLHFHDKYAQPALREYAETMIMVEKDVELGQDILIRLDSIAKEE